MLFSLALAGVPLAHTRVMSTGRYAGGTQIARTRPGFASGV
jgi:hypothetical protein